MPRNKRKQRLVAKPAIPAPSPRGRWFALAIILATLLGGGAWWALRGAGPDSESNPPIATPRTNAPASYVGSATCVECHTDQGAAWRGSNHAQAMQPMTPAHVRGRFDGATLTDASGSRFVMSREGERYHVATADDAGQQRSFPLRYTFGISPLQQYLAELPGGRLQALSVAWDAREAKTGGQRWFSLHGKDKAPPGDLLHWTGTAYNWNYMCADCHAVDVRKRYDAGRDVFDTRFAEIGVGCESCHGAGSNHDNWARDGAKPGLNRGLTATLDSPGAKRWQMDPARGIARRVDSGAGNDRTLLATCGQCHARRSQFADGHRAGEPLDEHYRIALLEPQLYFDDGQIREEVFEYGSFLQSRMHAAGVTCNDCHAPHSLKLRAEGNAVCATCHLPARFDTPAHHRHAAGSAGAACISCHMPARTYMVVDPRRDHSLRIPRPDLAKKLGTPDACTTCHRDRDAGWATAAATRWWGDPLRHGRHYGEVLHAARGWQPGSGEAVAQLVESRTTPAIVRATAASLLMRMPDARALSALRMALADDEPLVRLGAVEALAALPPEALRAELLRPLMGDSSKAVRLAIAPRAAEHPAEAFGTAAPLRELALTEYRAALAYNADRAESWLALGVLEARSGDAEREQAAYRRAIAIAPDLPYGYVNLADAQARAGDLTTAAATLEKAVVRVPANASLRFARGLMLVRQKSYAAAVRELRRAHELDRDEPRYAYTLAVALLDTGQRDVGLALMRDALRRFPGYPPLRQLASSVSTPAR